MWIADKWRDYELLDCGESQRLERWGNILLNRPDPQAIWRKSDPDAWEKADGVYVRSREGGGHWENRRMPENWQVGYGRLTFLIKPMGFKHTGIFPEQAANWDFIMGKVRERKGVLSVLNLFAYTGGATLAAAQAGAQVCHVDASKGMLAMAKDNAALSGLRDAPIRYIADDALKFVRRERNRGRRYDGIIMDPPSYGRGPSGEIWRFESDVPRLIEECAELMSGDPAFFIVNSYTAGFSPSITGYLLNRILAKRFGGTVEAGELGLPVAATGLALPCGSTARWRRDGE